MTQPANHEPSNPSKDLLHAATVAPGPVSDVDATTANEPSSAGVDRTFEFLAPARAPDELGRLGPYLVRQVLGYGGMGVVFLAEDPRLNRPVALKAMLPEVAQKAGAKERFLREARAIAALEHDHIVSIYQVDEDRGVPFIAMPLLKGLTLDDWLKQKQPGSGTPLKLAQILKIGREIAKGLAAAHERGLVHRDIKPANIWLDATAGGRVKLLDFGLARPASGAPDLTQTGAIVGTPSYMAPEQAQGQNVDARTDLFSLGVVLYRLCTGELPFRGADPISTLLAVVIHEPPAPRSLNSDLPEGLSGLVMKLLAKDPAQRYASALDVVQAITAIERDPARAAPTPLTSSPKAAVRQPAAGPRPRRWPWPALAAGIGVGALLICLAGVVVHLATRDRGGTQIAADQAEPPVAQRRDSPADPGAAKKVETPLPVPAPGPAVVPAPAIKPPENVEPPPARIVPDPAAPILRGHTGRISQIRFLPDGKRGVSVAWDATARLWDLATGKELRVFQHDWDKELNCIAVAPDGKTLAVGGSRHRIYLWDLDSGTRLQEIALQAPGIDSLEFAADGQRLWATSGGRLLAFQVPQGARLFDVPPLPAAVHGIAVVPGGKYAICWLKGHEGFLLWDIARGAELRRFKSELLTRGGVAFFADGNRFATAHHQGMVRLWSLATGAEVGHLQAHWGPAIRAGEVFVLHKDRWLLTTGEDKAIRIWDVQTRAMLHEARTDHLVTTVAALSPDARRLLTGGGWRLTARTELDGDYALRLWRLPVP